MGSMSEGVDLDPLYVAARRVLIDALVTLAPHGKAIIVVGAQAVYLRIGLNDVAIAIAPYTTDGDLALDPSLLGDEPELEASMQDAGFHRSLSILGSWETVERVGNEDVVICVDLMVPEAASTGEGTRGARLGVHGKRAARLAVGLEAALVDHGPMTITALDPLDTREVIVEVAGVAALLVAKVHKIHDRVVAGKFDRISDKDASDVYRIMQATRPAAIKATLHELLSDPVAGPVTDQALSYMKELFGRRSGEGVVMAQRALRLAIDEAQIATLSVAFTEQILVEPVKSNETRLI